MVLLFPVFVHSGMNNEKLKIKNANNGFRYDLWWRVIMAVINMYVSYNGGQPQ